jgi:outer membrane protein TolC
LQCEIALKLLVSLSGMTEAALRTVLDSTASPSSPALPQPAQFTIASVPAEVLRQRPDLAAAERSMAAANASIGATEADRYPRLNLVGNITPTRLIMNSGPAVSVTTWSITSSLLAPLIDGGRRGANVEAARADYRAAESLWRARVRNAVREVEEALLQLQSTQARSEDTRLAAEGYHANFLATETRQRAGLASRIELEEARRLDINARSAVTALTHERVQAWIALYRAVGGGWRAP